MNTEIIDYIGNLKKSFLCRKDLGRVTRFVWIVRSTEKECNIIESLQANDKVSLEYGGEISMDKIYIYGEPYPISKRALKAIAKLQENDAPFVPSVVCNIREGKPKRTIMLNPSEREVYDANIKLLGNPTHIVVYEEIIKNERNRQMDSA